MNINPEENYIQIEETRFRSPISEATLTRIGASINFLLDKVPFNVEKIEFLSSTTWIAPENALFGIVEGVGGGGGGGASYGSTVLGQSAAGGGGSSGSYRIVNTSLSPNLSYSVIIGSGGAGGTASAQSGADGLNSSFGSIVFNGGSGGNKNQTQGLPLFGGGRGDPRLYFAGSFMARGGNGQVFQNLLPPNPPLGRSQSGESFFDSFLGGLSSSVGVGGGGAAGPFGNGGDGGANSSSGPGASAAANTGAGGGGGGAHTSSGLNNVGGAGGSGRVILWLFTKA